MTDQVTDVQVISRRLRSDGTTASWLLSGLKALRSGGPEYLHTGICGQVDCYALSKELAPFWPKFSGDPDYPIPHPNMAAEEAYKTLSPLSGGDLWGDRAYLHLRDPDDQYRRNRWDYLDWLIEQLAPLIEPTPTTSSTEENQDHEY